MHFPFEDGSWLYFNETKDNRIRRNAGLNHLGRLMHIGVSTQGYHWFRKNVAWHYLARSSVLLLFLPWRNSNPNKYMFMQGNEFYSKIYCIFSYVRHSVHNSQCFKDAFWRIFISCHTRKWLDKVKKWTLWCIFIHWIKHQAFCATRLGYMKGRN